MTCARAEDELKLFAGLGLAADGRSVLEIAIKNISKKTIRVAIRDSPLLVREYGAVPAVVKFGYRIPGIENYHMFGCRNLAYRDLRRCK